MVVSRIYGVLLFAICALGSALPVMGQTALPSAELPAFKVGESWKFRTHNLGDKQEPGWYVNTVHEAGDKHVVLYGENSVPTKFWWFREVATAKLLMRFNYSETAPNKRGAKTRDISAEDATLQFPLQVGKKWTFKQNWTNSSGEPGSSDVKVEVTAYEKVKTEAGEYDAFKIEEKGWWKNLQSNVTGRQSQTLWYAPAVKRTVKSESKDFHSQGQLWNHRTEELLEYKPG